MIALFYTYVKDTYMVASFDTYVDDTYMIASFQDETKFVSIKLF
jgi:hypothetical protein